MSDSAHPLTLADCWAKTDPTTGLPALSVRDHCINVGATGAVIASRLPESLERLLPACAALLIAGHDLGKISPGFQLKSPAWATKWKAALRLEPTDRYEGRHAALSQKYFAGLESKPTRWLIALGGHHGKYLSATARPITGLDGGEPCFTPLRNELFAELAKAFGRSDFQTQIDKGAQLHWFTGMMIFSDWIGSNVTWFPLTPEPTTNALATTSAARAIDEIGSHRHAVRPALGFGDLFGFPAPRPLQKTLIDTVDSPGLYIVEAPMGDGKTEAALAAAYRRWTEGGERGLYFALPTQLTSNRIRNRVGQFLENIVADPSALALVHGSAWLTNNCIQPLLPSTPTATEEPDHSASANRWFSDSRRSMLAPFGVGTVDQALMAILPVKFSALRLFALGGKVVVIDEVHSYDPYTSALVDRAVAWLLEVQCTVIILSATLTAARRASLVEAAGAIETAPSSAYPLITKIPTGSKHAESIEIRGPAPTPKTIHIQIEPADDPSWLQTAAAAAEQGACVLVIRNTIALAQQTLRDLKTHCRDLGIEFGLIHSRFTQRDRDANEHLWMDRLGKSQACRPTRAILVGTQVLEQSVDIDADILITDLAPTDLILQRIGRLHRHERPRPDGYSTPRCLILRPPVDWNADVKTLEGQLAPHHFVYPPISLHLADQVWSSRDNVALPTDIRTVLEASSRVPDSLPDGLAHLKRDFDELVERQKTVALSKTPFDVTVDDLEGTETRWRMQPTAHLVLLAATPATSGLRITVAFPSSATVTFTNGVFDFPLARELNLHAIRVPRYLVRELLPTQPGWLKQHLPDGIIAVVDEFHQVSPCRGPDAHAYTFSYHPETGLTHERANVGDSPMFDDDESWY